MNDFAKRLSERPVLAGIFLALVVYAAFALMGAARGHWTGWAAPLPNAVGFGAVWTLCGFLFPRRLR